ncbi:11678_t:CDS:2 [Entrophospora sp. SA101]|nr:11678_t:CDS:2 [Entrophospora sp. SA101]
MLKKPFSVVENTVLKKMVCFCNMITKHLIIKTTTKKAFKAFPGQVSFTLDAWTSKNQIPFQGLLHIGLPSIGP